MKSKERIIKIFLIVLIFLLSGISIYLLPKLFSNDIEYNNNLNVVKKVLDNKKIRKKDLNKIIIPAIIPVIHIKTPSVVRAIYLSNWVAGTKKIMDPLIELINNTELNAVVIDIKDSTGRIGFNISDKEIQKIGSIQRRISNIRKLINSLHQKKIYVIGRIVVFQDPYLANLKPKWALTKKSDGTVWENKEGLAFLDPDNKNVYKYILDIALASYKDGFDEINFDYIRYPSDGDVNNIDYNLTPGQTKTDNIENFFKYISTNIKKNINIPISADLFGLTTSVTSDMGIGQVWDKTLPYFDFISPMLYPSHYSPGYLGYKNPAEYPYEIVYKSIINAIKKTKKAKQNINKIRPWLQDFDLGAVYTPKMVQSEMKAVYDSGLSSWMLWNPANKYNTGVLKLENNI